MLLLIVLQTVISGSLRLAFPYPNQAKSWSEVDIAEYERIKSVADSVVYVSDHYFRGCMQKRNRYLVDQSNLCVCYLTKQSGGTAYTVKYACEKGIETKNVESLKEEFMI